MGLSVPLPRCNRQAASVLRGAVQQWWLVVMGDGVGSAAANELTLSARLAAAPIIISQMLEPRALETCTQNACGCVGWQLQ